jgi:hypothetical protein
MSPEEDAAMNQEVEDFLIKWAEEDSTEVWLVEDFLEVLDEGAFSKH